jgi:hypothetical protein
MKTQKDAPFDSAPVTSDDSFSLSPKVKKSKGLPEWDQGVNLE